MINMNNIQIMINIAFLCVQPVCCLILILWWVMILHQLKLSTATLLDRPQCPTPQKITVFGDDKYLFRIFSCVTQICTDHFFFPWFTQNTLISNWPFCNFKQEVVTPNPEVRRVYFSCFVKKICTVSTIGCLFFLWNRISLISFHFFISVLFWLNKEFG